MALTIQVRRRIDISARILTAESFAPFGDVLENPRPDVHPSSVAAQTPSSSPPTSPSSVTQITLPPNAVSANQGYAIQYRHASRVQNLYPDHAPSRRPARPVVSLFVCSARPETTLAVRFLERHPFTSQTFSPLASTARAYLVIVAPSLSSPSPPELDKHLGSRSSNGDQDITTTTTTTTTTTATGLPDLDRLSAFVATHAQAVTYAAGTWHAPMVVLGPSGTTLDFVVSQFSNGVDLEDCQLLAYDGAPVNVKVPAQTGMILGKL